MSKNVSLVDWVQKNVLPGLGTEAGQAVKDQLTTYASTSHLLRYPLGFDVSFLYAALDNSSPAWKEDDIPSYWPFRTVVNNVAVGW